MTNPHNPHRPIHDRWMVNPNDVDYLAPADRWCVLCALDDSDPIHVPLVTDETIAADKAASPFFSSSTYREDYHYG